MGTPNQAAKLKDQWVAVMAAPNEAALRAILHPDCTFVSPVVHKPQSGRDVSMTYLLAAHIVFKDSQFRYVSELLGEQRMVLEFEAEIDGKHINGVDIIDFDADGRITQFKVMVRPLQAVNMVWQKMGEMLEARQSASS